MGLQNTAVRISGYSSMKTYIICISQFTKYKQSIYYSSLGNTLYFTTNIVIIMLKTYTFGQMYFNI